MYSEIGQFPSNKQDVGPVDTRVDMEPYGAQGPSRLTSKPQPMPLQSPRHFVEASSGLFFPQVMRHRINGNPSDSQRRQDYAWNLGLRSKPLEEPISLAEIIPKHEMKRLAKVYFEKVHPLYSFVDRVAFIQQVEQTWNDVGSAPHDAVLCGVAALGSLFSRTHVCDHEADIVRCAKNNLEMTSFLRLPSLDHVAAWILRTLYLRMAVGPHAGWMASCITMHIVEAAEAH